MKTAILNFVIILAINMARFFEGRQNKQCCEMKISNLNYVDLARNTTSEDNQTTQTLYGVTNPRKQKNEKINYWTGINRCLVLKNGEM